MLVPDDNHGFPLYALQRPELQAISKGADVTFVGVEEIYRPVLSGFSVVAERTHNLEL